MTAAARQGAVGVLVPDRFEERDGSNWTYGLLHVRGDRLLHQRKLTGQRSVQKHINCGTISINESRYFDISVDSHQDCTEERPEGNSVGHVSRRFVEFTVVAAGGRRTVFSDGFDISVPVERVGS